MIAPRFFDAHGHLQDSRVGPEVASVLKRASVAGVEGVACCGTGPEDWDAVLALAERHPEVVPLLGLHPWRVAEAPPDWRSSLNARLSASGAGLGECGLDFAQPGDRAAQLEAFRFQVRLARELNRPLALHCVKAWGPFLEVLRAEGLPSAGAMVHAYSGSAEVARELQALGLFLSFAGNVDRPGARKVIEAARAVRPDRLLVESDTPDQGPGGGPSEPAQVPAVVAALARIRGESVEALAEATRANARALFGRCRA